ncbi:hypothetical protein FNJ62_27250, partial [Streptomyces benahoarensis]
AGNTASPAVPAAAFSTCVVQVEKAAAGTAGDAVFPARFRLYGVRTVEGGRAFTGLEVTYDGSTPMGDTTEMYSLA